MKRHEVDLEITKTYRVTVAVEGNFENDKEVEKAAKEKADLMNHEDWDYEYTVMDAVYVYEGTEV